MRIHEIVGGQPTRQAIDKLHRHTAVGKITNLEQGLGFEQLDRGSYATVLVHPKLSYVIKLFDASDKGYQAFLKVVKANPDNPHFPKLRGQPMNFGRWAGIRMERLQPYSLREFQDIEYMLDHAFFYDNWRDAIKPNSIHSEFLEQWPEMGNALDALRRTLKTVGGIRVDWHQGNIMQRSDGTPVIIDPFANR